MYKIVNALTESIPFCGLRNSTSEQDDRYRNAPGHYASLKHGRTHYVYTPAPANIQPPKDLVVLLHGASVYSFIWDRFVRWFSERGHPVLVFDFYGHGFSDCPKMEFSVDIFCQQFEHLLEFLQISDSHSSFILIGHSMGGLISSLFTSRHKEMVSHLVLINCAGIAIQKSFTVNPLPTVLRFAQDLIRKTSYLDHMVHALAGVLKFHGSQMRLSHDDLSKLALALDEGVQTSKEAVKTEVKTVSQRVLDFIPEDGKRLAKAMTFLYKSWVHQCSLVDRAPVLLSVLRGCMLLDGDYTKEFSSIDIPTLIIWGDADALLPKTLAEGMKKCIPHAEVYIVNGDHAAFLQKPADIFQNIVDFHNFGTISHRNGV